MAKARGAPLKYGHFLELCDPFEVYHPAGIVDFAIPLELELKPFERKNIRHSFGRRCKNLAFGEADRLVMDGSISYSGWFGWRWLGMRNSRDAESVQHKYWQFLTSMIGNKPVTCLEMVKQITKDEPEVWRRVKRELTCRRRWDFAEIPFEDHVIPEKLTHITWTA